jgi:ssDNA-binding Zn-finger/Zn-ribbon topoisomerase 1
MPNDSSNRAGHGPVLLQGRPSTCPKCGGQTRDNKPRGAYECKLKACGWISRYRNPSEPMRPGPSSSKIGMAWSRQDKATGVYRNFRCPKCGAPMRYQRLRPGLVVIACSDEHCSLTVDDVLEAEKRRA